MVFLWHFDPESVGSSGSCGVDPEHMEILREPQHFVGCSSSLLFVAFGMVFVLEEGLQHGSGTRTVWHEVHTSERRPAWTV